MKVKNTVSALLLAGLIMAVPAANAQRGSGAGGAFEGIWKGQLPMQVLYDIPAADVARLSKPIELELRIFSKGGAELYFSFDEDEWEFTQQRGFRLTGIGDENAVVIARIPGTVGWDNSIALNLTKKNEDTILLSWTRLVTRAQMLNDGLDTMGFAGVADLTRTGSADDDGGKKKKKK